MTDKVLIANRGAIAVRILRTLKKLNIPAVVIYSEADKNNAYVRYADEAYSLGAGPASDTYLNQDLIISLIQQSGATAVHPGYGFLSENAGFAQRLETMGIAFLGPTAEQMRLFGLKHKARQLAQDSGVPLLSGSDLLDTAQTAIAVADDIGYPVMLKSTAGGGGIGMQVCRDQTQLSQAWDGIKRLSENNFSDGGLFLEKYVDQARHIEVQVFGDGEGGVLVLGDRDCSTQRRNQKVLEEAPAPNIPDSVRVQLHQVAQNLAASVNYRSAGTVEFIYDQSSHDFYFLEMNTRLQVEHGVTEQVFNVDLVAWMVELGLGRLPGLHELSKNSDVVGHSIQARIYAENPNKSFQPSAGLLTQVKWPEQTAALRVDHWVETGTEVSAFYDPMLGKVIATAPTRAQAIALLGKALSATVLQGAETNVDYVCKILTTDTMQQGKMTTRFLSTFEYRPCSIDVISPGTMTTVQDFPGRTGLWHVGVPPSGPFDDVSFQVGNVRLGNPASAPGLEMTHQGATLKLNHDCRFMLMGAHAEAFLDGEPVRFGLPVSAKADQVLKIGKVKQAGARMYFLIEGGLCCEPYLGSCSTFTLGQFGGVHGRALKAGDVLDFNSPETIEAKRSEIASEVTPEPTPEPTQLSPPVAFKNRWQLRVMYGPHGAPDFFTKDDLQTFFDTRWKVHYNSSRTGVRLIGPKPEWARSDGGEAGMHPSNIHDNAYAIGSVDFTGDMPVILGPDGPSLGGFVCPVTVVSADLWKLGQLRADDTIEFVLVDLETALQLKREQGEAIACGNLNMAITDAAVSNLAGNLTELSPIVAEIEAERYGTQVVYRQAGDDNLLVEYGPLVLDIQLRFRVHALMLLLASHQQSNPDFQAAILDITPGVRSLQVHYDPDCLTQADLVSTLQRLESGLQNLDEMSVPSRVVHLPLSWDDAQCRLAIEKYMQSVRKEAPWCPSNIEFIRRINGLASVEDVKKIVFDASYVVMGLGDVYLGAPVATPLNPCHRLVTTKYNPARTWTAENSVGIGGSYLCIYGMEGPGGYQFVGRTSQMWNRFHRTPEFSEPWLLRFFDQIRFYEVSAEELVDIRAAVPYGQYPIKIEETTFSLKDYLQFLQDNQPRIQTFTAKRNAAFAEELQRWKDSGQFHFESESALKEDQADIRIPEGCELIESPVSGNIWQLMVKEGDRVETGQTVCILESMKMEIDIPASCAGVVEKVYRVQGKGVSNGEALMLVRQD